MNKNRKRNSRIKPNDPCPCNSSKKFKKCCAENPYLYIDPHTISDQVKNKKKQLYDYMRKNKLKKCFHPEKKQCSAKPIKAHSIQKAILDRIAHNGKVMMVDVSKGKEIFTVDVLEKGVSSATTFQCFCQYHDQMFFREIETEDFNNSPKQIFLLTFRTFVCRYYQALEHHYTINKSFELIPHLVREQQQLQAKQKSDKEIEFFKYEYQLFENAILSEAFDIIDAVYRELNYESKIALSTYFFPLQDFENNFLQPPLAESQARAKKLFINLFPQKGKTYMVFSWLKEDSEFFHAFKEQLETLSDEQVRNLINNSCSITQNVAISPMLWAALPNKERYNYKQSYLNKLTGQLSRSMKSYISQSSYDLLQCLD